jgi:hypothetical protein
MAAAPKQLTSRRPSAICSQRVGRAYTPAGRLPATGVASPRGCRGLRPGFDQSFEARGRSVVYLGGSHLLRLGLSARRDGRWRGVAVVGCSRRLRRWSGPRPRAQRTLAGRSRPDAACHLQVYRGCSVARGGEWVRERDPAVTNVFRPRTRGGSSERPLWLGRRTCAASPRGTSPKAGRSSTGRSGGRPGTARDACTDGLADMTRSSWRSGEPSKLSILQVARDLTAALLSSSADSAVPRDSCRVRRRLPPTDSIAALSSGHAQHVGHQCRYR